MGSAFRWPSATSESGRGRRLSVMVRRAGAEASDPKPGVAGAAGHPFRRQLFDVRDLPPIEGGGNFAGLGPPRQGRGTPVPQANISTRARPDRDAQDRQGGLRQTVTVRFTQPINQSEIDRLQTWQEGHDYQDGGTYGAKITDTFGNVH